MMQREDWPLCSSGPGCGDWCEFVGNPRDKDAAVLVPSEYQFWDRCPTKWSGDFEIIPESLREVCLFRCSACGQGYFIWKPT
jgi:hypothetical protein